MKFNLLKSSILPLVILGSFQSIKAQKSPLDIILEKDRTYSKWMILSSTNPLVNNTDIDTTYLFVFKYGDTLILEEEGLSRHIELPDQQLEVEFSEKLIYLIKQNLTRTEELDEELSEDYYLTMDTLVSELITNDPVIESGIDTVISIPEEGGFGMRFIQSTSTSQDNTQFELSEINITLNSWICVEFENAFSDLTQKFNDLYPLTAENLPKTPFYDDWNFTIIGGLNK